MGTPAATHLLNSTMLKRCVLVQKMHFFFWVLFGGVADFDFHFAGFFLRAQQRGSAGTKRTEAARLVVYSRRI